MPPTRARHCPACHRSFESAPIFREDEGYCCAACSRGSLCLCLVEADLADDGVDGLGLPFGLDPVAHPRGSLVA